MQYTKFERLFFLQLEPVVKENLTTGFSIILT